MEWQIHGLNDFYNNQIEFMVPLFYEGNYDVNIKISGMDHKYINFT